MKYNTQANAAVKSWFTHPHVSPYPQTIEQLQQLVSDGIEIVHIVNDLNFPCLASGVYMVHYPPLEDSWYKAHEYTNRRCGTCEICGNFKDNPLHQGQSLIPLDPWKAVVRYQKVNDENVYPKFRGTVFDYRIVEVLQTIKEKSERETVSGSNRHGFRR